MITPRFSTCPCKFWDREASLQSGRGLQGRTGASHSRSSCDSAMAC